MSTPFMPQLPDGTLDSREESILEDFTAWTAIHGPSHLRFDDKVTWALEDDALRIQPRSIAPRS